MNVKSIIIIASLTCGSVYSATSKIKRFSIPLGKKLSSEKIIDGEAVVVLNTQTVGVKVSSNFFGADLNAFSPMPSVDLTKILNLGFLKTGGNYYSVTNWKLNSFLDLSTDEISYATPPIVNRIDSIHNSYKSKSLFQVNLMGWQPDYLEGVLSMRKSADADHAANQLRFYNEEKKLDMKNILMGNEPFNWHETHANLWTEGAISADDYIKRYIEYAVKLRETQESISGNPNDIKLWGPEIATGWNGWQTGNEKDCKYNDIGKMVCSYGNGQFKKFIPYFLTRLKEFEYDEQLNPNAYQLLDVLTFHYYPLFRTNYENTRSIIKDQNGREFVTAMLQSAANWDDKTYINRWDSSSLMGETSDLTGSFNSWRDQYYPEAKVAVTEFGIDSRDDVFYHPIVRPLYLADIIGRIGKAGISTFVKSFLNSGSGETALNSWSMITNNRKGPQFNVYQQFTESYSGDVLEATDNYGDWVNVYSTFSSDDADRSINIILVNKDAMEHNTVVKLLKPSTQVTTSVCDLTLPAWSVTTLKINASSSQPIDVTQFGARQMGVRVNSYYSSSNQ